MRLVALTPALAFAIAAYGCAHAAPVEAPAGQAAAPPATPGDDGLWRKIDPRLRASLADKTATRQRAIARLSGPLPEGARAELEARGLRFLALRADYAHVEGDAEALLRLAARDEVTRLGPSGAVVKSTP